MPDTFGGLQFPAQTPPTVDDSVTDPSLDKLGGFVAAALNDSLNAAWITVNPGKKFVEQWFTNSPVDSDFNERDLPALFLWRNQTQDEQYADAILRTVTDVTVLWVPQNAVQAMRSLRDPGLNGFQKTISRALYLGRIPAWSDPRDPDPNAVSLGSSLMLQAGFSHWPFCTAARREPVVIAKGDSQATYAAFTLTIKISEVTEWDQGVAGSTSTSPAVNAPSKVDILSTNGAIQLESTIPTT